MIKRFFKLAPLLLLVFFLGCGSHRTQTVQQPKAPQPQAAEVVPPVADKAPGVEMLPPDSDAAFTEQGGDSAAVAVETATAPAAAEAIEAAKEDPPPSESGREENASAEEAAVEVTEEIVENGQTLLDQALDLVNSSQEHWSEGNQEKALSVLDEAYGLALKVDTEANPEYFQQKEDLRYLVSKRILEIYASRYTATNGHYEEIPLTLNEYVEKEIKQFQGPERKFFEESYRRSGKYMPMIRQSLKEAGLPQELAWVPLIESGFKANALSSARALGLWQFIASTGQKFGLKRDTWVDERLDFKKSTDAAIAYLKELHQIFGDWTTVLAGYNCGEGRVLRKIRSQKVNYLDNFWDLFQMLPYETARYVPRFLATLHILKDPGKYGFELAEPDDPFTFETVEISKPVQLKAVAEAIGAKEESLADLNPELRYKATPATAYALRIPEGTGDLLLARIDDIPKYSPPRNTYVNHTVRKGETLSDIAAKYRTTVARIVQANNIRKKDFIRIGQRLKVPLTAAAAAAAGRESAPPKLSEDGKYRVQKGDSLWTIARKFNTDTKEIQQLNGLKDTRLQIGQILEIP